jgi:hypothetical protein
MHPLTLYNDGHQEAGVGNAEGPILGRIEAAKNTETTEKTSIQDVDFHNAIALSHFCESTKLSNSSPSPAGSCSKLRGKYISVSRVEVKSCVN